jgi:NAD(P)-dependent dehydrogenase (short-subunit alcohol dehydrogenase family)
MAGRLEGKAVVVVGAGQTPGETIGNGRAMALLFAREGARVVCVDLVLERAGETATMVGEEGGVAFAVEADIARSADCARLVEESVGHLGRIDVLINNVGIGGGDAPAHRLEEAAFDRILDVNLKGMWLTIKDRKSVV